jgi:hypothetical protein
VIVSFPRSSLIYMDNEKIEVMIPDNSDNKNIDYNAVKRSEGIFRNKNIIPLEFQKNIRNEWQ